LSRSSPSVDWARVPTESIGLLVEEHCAGDQRLLLDGAALPEGARIQLHRAGQWHEASVAYDDFMRLCIVVHAGEWPGSPCRLYPQDLNLVEARLSAGPVVPRG